MEHNSLCAVKHRHFDYSSASKGHVVEVGGQGELIAEWLDAVRQSEFGPWKQFTICGIRVMTNALSQYLMDVRGKQSEWKHPLKTCLLLSNRSMVIYLKRLPPVQTELEELNVQGRPTEAMFYGGPQPTASSQLLSAASPHCNRLNSIQRANVSCSQLYPS
ncbi:hypothetical protein GOODEAATRI_009657 [Goodea atripinnis]|uniref:Uncharacterized protein n=1 Tax=Goodea atripinnis TaxID=208336 RepID=A0ABV0MQS8_9TELE